MNRDVFLAILSMDSYNRGYGSGLAGLLENGRIGSAEVRSFEIGEQNGWAQAGFYAVAYDWTYDVPSADGTITVTETIISYRGTNFDTDGKLSSPVAKDAFYGWTLGAGYPGASQAGLAIKFFEDVTGRGLYEFDPTGGGPAITLTGHSLGGGVAGFVGSLGFTPAVGFDHMPYGIAAWLQVISEAVKQAALENAVDLAQVIINLEGVTSLDDILDGALTVREFLSDVADYIRDYDPSLEKLRGIYFEDEILEGVRNGVIPATLGSLLGAIATIFTQNPIVAVGLASAGIALGLTTSSLEEQTTKHEISDYGAEFGGIIIDPLVARHSMALLTTTLFGENQWGGSDWKQSYRYIAPHLSDDKIGTSLGLAKGKDGAAASAGTQMSHMIAYSAIDEGVRPFGDTGIRALFNDADDLGNLIKNYGNILPNVLDEDARISIGKLFVEYAGFLASKKIESAMNAETLEALQGVARFSEEGDKIGFLLDLSDIAWKLEVPSIDAPVNPIDHDPSTKKELVESVISFGGSNFYDIVNQWYGVFLGKGDFVNKVATISFALEGGRPFEDSRHDIANMIELSVTSVNGNPNIPVKFSARDNIIIGESGVDWINGGKGDDALIGGGGNDILIGGLGSDLFIGGSGNDQINGDDDQYDEDGYDIADYSASFRITFKTTQEAGIYTVSSYADGIDTLKGIERIVATSGYDTFIISHSFAPTTKLTIDGGGGQTPPQDSSGGVDPNEKGLQLIDGSNNRFGLSLSIEQYGYGEIKDLNTGGVIKVENFGTRILGSNYDDEIEDLSEHDKFVDGGDGNDLIVTGIGDDIIIDHMERLVAEESDGPIGTYLDMDDNIIENDPYEYLDEVQSVIDSGAGDDIIALSARNSGRSIFDLTGYDPDIKKNYRVNPGEGNDVSYLDFEGGFVNYYYAYGDGNDVIHTTADLRYMPEDSNDEIGLFGAGIGLEINHRNLSDITVTYNIENYEAIPGHPELIPDFVWTGNVLISFADGGSIVVDNAGGLARGPVVEFEVLTSSVHYYFQNPYVFGDVNVVVNVSSGANNPEPAPQSAAYGEPQQPDAPSSAESSFDNPEETTGDNASVDENGNISAYFGRGLQHLDGAIGTTDEIIVDVGASDITASLVGDTLTISDKWGVIGTAELTDFESIYLSQEGKSFTPQELIDFLATVTEAEIVGTEGDDTLVGSIGADTMSGLGGNDDLSGGTGNDYLDGGTGQDAMSGGEGDDHYIVDNAGDDVIELLDKGYDTVEASVDYILADNVEALIITGAATSGTGNGLANRLSTINAIGVTLNGQGGDDYVVGNQGNDSLYGDDGDDVISGGAGQDTLFGGVGVDLLNGGDGDDILDGGDGDDLLSGGWGNDELFGGTGDDILYGQRGNDLFIASQGNDVISGGEYKDISDAGESSYLHSQEDLLQLTGRYQDYLIEKLGNGWLRITDSIAGRDGIDLIYDIAQINFAGALEGDITSIRVKAPGSDIDGASRTIDEDESFSVDISDDFLTFGVEDFEYSATMQDGSPLPEWVSLQGTTLSGTPPINFNGLVSFTVTCSNQYGSAQIDYSFDFAPVNDAPVVASPIEDIEVNAGEGVSIDISDGVFTDVDGDALAYSVTLAHGSSLPSWLTFADGILTGSAPAEPFDPIEILVTASDGVEIISSGFTISQPTSQKNLIAPSSSGQTINGTDGNDHIIGLGSDSIYAGAGDDLIENSGQGSLIFTGSGADIVYGGDFNDQIDGNAHAALEDYAADQLHGGGGNDEVVGYAEDVIWGDDGNDYLVLKGSNATAFGGDGDDNIVLFAEQMSGINIDGGTGYDTLDMSWHRWNTIASMDGIERIDAGGYNSEQPITLYITPSIDLSSVVFTGHLYVSSVWSSTIPSTIVAPAALPGSSSSLRLGGGQHGDTLIGSLGSEIIMGLWGNDTVRGGAGDDTLYGDGVFSSSNDGSDIIEGGAGNDIIYGQNGSDIAEYKGALSTFQLVTDNGILTIVDQDQQADGDEGTDQLYGIEQLVFKDDQNISITSPIILDLRGDGVTLLSSDQSHSTFDMNNDGQADDTSWIGRGDGFLFLDRDGNGTVTNVGELSFIEDVQNARSDLDGLKAFDSNQDGILDQQDERFTDFGVWQDRNGDGVVNNGEIKTLHQAQIQSLSFSATAVNGSYDFGDVAVLNQGSFTRTNGTTSTYLDAAMTFYSGQGSDQQTSYTGSSLPAHLWWKMQDRIGDMDLFDEHYGYHGPLGRSLRENAGSIFNTVVRSSALSQRMETNDWIDRFEMDASERFTQRLDWVDGQGRFELLV